MGLYPCKPKFYYLKLGFEGVSFSQTCLLDVWFHSGGGGAGVLTYKMGMYVPPLVKKKGAYGESGCFPS